MSDRRPEPTKPKAKSEPKKAKKSETAILSPEELRAISGGLGGSGSGSGTQPPSGPSPLVKTLKP